MNQGTRVALAAVGLTAGALVHWHSTFLPAQAVWFLAVAVAAVAVLGWGSPSRNVAIGLGAWAAGGLIGAFTGPEPVSDALRAQFVQDGTFLGGALLGAYLWRFRDRDSLANWLIPALLVLAVAIGTGVLQALGLIQPLIDPYGAIDFAGGLGLSNFTAEWAVVLSFVLVAGAAKQPVAKPLALVLATVVAVYAGVTGARTALAALALGAAAPIAMARPRLGLPLLGGLVAAAIAGVAIWGGSDAPVRYRLMVQADGVRMVAQEPLGAGVGGFSRALDGYLSPALDQETWERNVEIRSPHNLLVEAAAERGWLGLGALLAGVGLLARRFWRRRDAIDQRLLAGGAAAWLVVALGSVVSSVPAIWILGGAVVGGAWPGIAPADRRPGLPLRGLAVAVLAAGTLMAWHQCITEIYLRDALVHQKKGEGLDAELDFLAAAQRDPGDYRPWFNLGVIRAGANDLEGAIDAFQHGARARPTLERLHEAITVLGAQLKQWEAVHAAVPGWWDAPGFHARGLYYAAALDAIAQQDFPDALRRINEGLDRFPNEATLLRTKVKILMNLERWQDALDELEHLATLAPPSEEDTRWAEIAREQLDR